MARVEIETQFQQRRGVVTFRRQDAGQPPHAGHASRDTLVETDRGRALRCRGCGRIQIRFGNAVWVRKPEAVRRFRRSLERQARELSLETSDGERELYLTFGSGNAYCFGLEDVPELRRLFHVACAELDR